MKWITAAVFCLFASASNAAVPEKVVNVYNWSDYITPEALKEFTATTGIKVVYDVYDNNEVVEAKLLAGSTGYDLVFPTARPFAQRQIAGGIYKPLDKSKLPNLKNIDPILLKSLQDVDPGNQYLVPYMWGTTGIGINEAKVRAALGPNAPLDSWSLLFDPTNAKKLAGCGISIMDDEIESLGAALIYQGKAPNTGDAASLTAVANMYAAIRPSVRYFSSSKYIDDLANGDLCIAMGYSGDVIQARNRAKEAKNGVNVRYIIPKEGAIRWVDLAAIPKDAPHTDNALALLNFLLQGKNIAGVSNKIGYANANSASLPFLVAEVRNDPGTYPPAAVLAKLQDNTTAKANEHRVRVRAWTRIKSGK
jgi:putrescine transport system substrate-binding protein